MKDYPTLHLRNITHVFLFTVNGLPTPPPNAMCSRPGYVSRGTSCYKFVKLPVQTWSFAEKLCQGDGGVLSSINSVFENAYIESQMGSNVDFWIGLQYNKVHVLPF